MSKILVVEDEKNLRLLYSKELSLDGYAVVTADGVGDALAAIEREQPDLVVLDLRPPPLDGLDTLGRILGARRRVPIVLNTDYVSYVDDFQSWAADGVIFKSSDTSELRSKIRELLAVGAATPFPARGATARGGAAV